MSASDDKLSAERIASLIRDGCSNDVTVEVFAALPSTNRYLAEQASAQFRGDTILKLPMVCATDQQTEGVGRRGSTWVSSAGSVTFSVMLTLSLRAERLMGLSLVAGISVAHVLQPLTTEPVQVKWPNDVLIGDKKVSGLLVELQPGIESGNTVVIIGIGINYNESAAVERLGIGGTSLHYHAADLMDRNALISAIGSQLLQNLAIFAEQGWPAFAASWRDADYLHGREVRLLQREGELVGRSQGVDERGALLVQPAQKRSAVQTILSGDVSVRPM